MKYLIITFLVLLIFSCTRATDSFIDNNPYSKLPNQTAIISTSLGDIEVELFNKQAPKTVANFIQLAHGQKTYTDPRTKKRTKAPYYDNTIFHRVIKNFMIQAGDPTGTGQGGPGYTFEDEITPQNKNVRGTLSMANRGPNTNGSQFFINVVNNNYLDKKHTVFGKVTKAMNIVDKIARTSTDFRNRPTKPIIIKSIRLKKIKTTANRKHAKSVWEILFLRYLLPI